MHKQVLYALTAGIAGYVAAVSYKVCLPSPPILLWDRYPWSGLSELDALSLPLSLQKG